uniref:YqaJ viral recombinase domain-containing protein n=1 Tax=viral metagenome TaxID=1070528 RepID=A0A6C0I6E0_9ZZZZ
MNSLIFTNALQELNNIIDEIKADENVMYFSNEDALELYNTCLYLMEEFIRNNPKLITDPDFDNIFEDNIEELMFAQFEDDIFFNDDAEEELDDIILEATCDFFKDFMPIRSYEDARILGKPDYDYIGEQLTVLRGKPQPAQRTPEWYQFRHNLITASNAYKAFDSQATKNQLIYEKCQPLTNSISISNSNALDSDLLEEVKMVNVNSPLHWGQKYEPLSVRIYEKLYKTGVEDFGCIQDEEYAFLGASPDGINTDIESPRYGRMLEIKNIVNREIDGIPKKEYWIQMQLQMKVCDLDECDFLETRFIEYSDQDAFNEDVSPDEIHEDDYGKEYVNACLSKEQKHKGIIIYFHTKEGKPYYVYKPLDIIEPTHIQKWEEIMLDLYQSEKYNYTYIKFIYWKLEEMSCVLVSRNRQWFEDNIWELEELWTTVLEERVSGFEHRAPNRKTKKDTTKYNVFELLQQQTQKSQCLLKFNSIVKLDI